MDTLKICELIDLYSLEDCLSILALYAPDLLASLREDVLLHPNDPETLKRARRAVHEARARENRIN